MRRGGLFERSHKTSLLLSDFYSGFGLNVVCFTVYTKGANVTSLTPASVSTKTTKVVTLTTPSVTNFSSEPASKTIHESSTKAYALRPQDPSLSNSLTTYRQWSTTLLPPPLRKPDNGKQVCSSVNEAFTLETPN